MKRRYNVPDYTASLSEDGCFSGHLGSHLIRDDDDVEEAPVFFGFRRPHFRSRSRIVLRCICKMYSNIGQGAVILN